VLTGRIRWIIEIKVHANKKIPILEREWGFLLRDLRRDFGDLVRVDGYSSFVSWAFEGDLTIAEGEEGVVSSMPMLGPRWNLVPLREP
jgi:hypothetical protein